MSKAENATLPFHNKYRPTRLSEYIGNKKEVERLMNVLKKSRPQVMLFHGSSGCGKTSLARLVAKEYVCEDRNPLWGACGKCPSCIEIEEYIISGRYENLVNIIEVDVASNSGKQAIDAVLEDAYYPLYGGGWKIYIFDECHAASPQAQTRMLKIAEEPPENVLMLFCTTDPDKMLETLHNRCQYKFQITKPKTSELVGLLESVCQKEAVVFDKKALSIIASRSNNTPRNSLIGLEGVLKDRNEVTYNNTIDYFGAISDELLFKFFDLLINRDIIGYVRLMYDIKTKMEFKTFVDSLCEFTQRGVYILNNAEVEGLSVQELKQYKNLFSSFKVSEIGALLKKLLDLKFSGEVETKLLFMGYTPLCEDKVSTQSSISDIEPVEDEIVKEKQESILSQNAKREMTPDEKNEFISGLTKEASDDDILNLFGAEVVDNDK